MENLKNIADILIKLGTELNKIADDITIKTEKEDKEVLLTKEEVLEQYKCFNSSSLYSAVQNGLPSYKVGRHRYYKAVDIDTWISNKSEDVSHKSFVRF